MTREQAIKEWIIPAIKNMWNEKKCKEILEALEQEPILDKIRAEIEQHRRKTQGIDPYDLVGDCLDIIDEYKGESEE